MSNGEYSNDIERAFVDEDTDEQTEERDERPVGPLLYLEDGTPVRVRAMDKDGEFLTYQGSPEQGFYVFESEEEQATVVFDPDQTVQTETHCTEEEQ